MKKKITFLLFFLSLACPISLAQEMQMPTDEEILQVLEKYDFSKEQKEYLLKETKRTLQENLTNGNLGEILNNQELEQPENNIQIEEPQVENSITPPVVKEKRRKFSDEHSFRAAKQRRQQTKQLQNQPQK